LYSKNLVNEKLINLLENNGFIYKNQTTDVVVRDIILNVLNRIGKSYSKALIYQICNFYGLTQNELLSNYELFEYSLTRVLGKTGYPIILRIKKELLKYLILNKFDVTTKDILDPSFNVPKIIDHLSESYNYQLIFENLNNNKRNHMILLSSDYDTKHIEKIVTNLLQSSKSSRDIKRVLIVLHDQFNKKRYFKSVPDMDIYYMNDLVPTLDKSLQKNNHNNKNDFLNIEQFYTTDIQIFCFIDIQILSQFDKYNILKLLEEKFKELYTMYENIKICCIYDLSNFYAKEYETNSLKDFINHHNTVIIDKPLLAMYQKFNIKKDILK
jgi:hypothetical protein